MSSETLTLVAVGDTTPAKEPESADFLFTHAHDILDRGDVRFAQVERLFSKRGTFQLQGNAPKTRVDPERATAYRAAGFDVVSLASNLTGSWGPEAVVDSVDTFTNLGIVAIGAGATIAEARKPAVFERNGITIAILAYCSVLLPQYWATEDRAGAAPMRAKTYYEPYEYQPGSPPRVVTYPVEADLQALVADVRKAKQTADHVVVSIHWGVHHVPRPLADYQPVVAHAAIDAGASVILGHHPHLMQGIEKYRDGVIFYALGNFAFQQQNAAPGVPHHPSPCSPNGEYTIAEVYSRELGPDLRYDFDQYFREAGAACLTFSRDRLESARLIPTRLNDRSQPEVQTDEQRAITRRYLEWCGAGIPGGMTRIDEIDGEFVISSHAPPTYPTMSPEVQ